MPSGVGVKYFPDINGSPEVPSRKASCKQNTRQLCSKNRTDPTQRNLKEDICIRALLWTVLSIILFPSSYIIPDLRRPQAFPGWVKFHPSSPCFHRLTALRRILRLNLVSTRHTTYWGFPPCSLRGGAKNVCVA